MSEKTEKQNKNEILFLGIDDAGRGPVIGPMVLAGCLVDEKTKEEFRKIGVKDSKQLTQKRREFLEIKIKEKAISYHIVFLSPEEIDDHLNKKANINNLEAIASAEIINKINSLKDVKGKRIKVILDCPSNSINKWKDFLKTKIEDLSNLEIICEHKADRNHVVVSAASILAKTAREREMEKIRKNFGEDIGSGYSSDPITRKFLNKNIKKFSNTGLFRKSWKTWKKANHDSYQKKLF
ncbi:MAG: ribonuclease HII [Candidatus Pacearchaeota archaeon]|nr:MAG: ribonuclease HII [Candidatus Pacearchaeota archaeon]